MTASTILLDRDGVINAAVRDCYILAPDQLALVPGAGEGLAALHQAGFRLAVVSNQQCVGKGLLTPEGLDAITDRLCGLVREAGAELADFFYCPHLAAEDCKCRKPKPGLLIQAAERYRLDLAETFFIGDSYSDLEAGHAAGARLIFVRTGLDEEKRQAGTPFPHEPEYVADDLRDAAAYIIRRRGAP